MTIAIIADTHNNTSSIDLAIKYLNVNHIGTIIHCGDAANKDFLEYLLRIYPGDIYYAQGNADINTDKVANNRFHYFTDMGEIQIDGKLIIFAHKKEDILKHKTQKYDFGFYGHTHTPWIDKNLQLANPGEMANSINHLNTFALYNTKDNKIKLITTVSSHPPLADSNK